MRAMKPRTVGMACDSTITLHWCRYYASTRLVFGMRLLQARQKSGRTCLEVSRIWETLARPAPRLSRSLQNLQSVKKLKVLQM